ncbi:MAG TPA: hypothetical protein VK501_17160 [Baekduia sp.]|uniref:hypothetical protein n=1 Tax=Baekduia sp. TaxID=2600305 RepID=UPI002BBF69A1|nr:hypothetical protein [Baekduia sp.]HMJ35640.1 hypothetical protein [Baekduia sp.]
MSARPPLRDLRVPGEEDARRRAWAVAQAALAERPAAAPRRGPVPPLGAVATLCALVAVAAGLTSPGRATAEWVRARIASVADPAPHHARRAPTSTTALPGGGRILVVNDHGPTVLGLPTGTRVLLGAVDEAAWSPHGLYVAAVRGVELIAVDLRGRRRWHVAQPHAIRAPAWSPSGFRVAYLTGAPGSRTLRVVAGDGTGDRPVAAAGPVRPTWAPGTTTNVLAYLDGAGRITVRDVDSGAVLWRARPRATPRTLSWSHDGHRLIAVGARDVTAYTGRFGQVAGSRRAPHGTENVSGAFAPYGRRYVVVRRVRATGDHRLLLVAHGRERLLQVGSGPIRSVAWGPDGHWLVLDQPGRPAWSLMQLTARGPDIPRTLAPGRGARLSGWCCSTAS